MEAGIQRQGPFEGLAGCIPTIGALQAQSQIVMCIGVVRLGKDHGEVAQGCVVEAAQCKFDLPANGIEIRVVFAWIGERAQSFLQTAGRAQRQGGVDLRLDAGFERDFNDVGGLRHKSSTAFRG